ncbi:MAG: Uncharacterised protein [Owenweeksia sp. TMED14]|nr:MAG: Uncharacterised protein [Owenweeksia sp. TMED14]
MRISKYIIPLAILLLAISTRFIPHIPNFTAIGSVAILGGFWMRGGRLFLIIPLLILFLSDIILNIVVYKSSSLLSSMFYPGMGFVYAGHLAMFMWGFYIVKKPNALKWMGHAAGANLIFFILSNFGVWFGNPSLPQNIFGLLSVYAAAIPFYLSSLAGTVVYGGVMLAVLYKAAAFAPLNR